MNIFYIQIIFYYCQKVLFTLRVFLLLSLLNDASVDILDDEVSFQFSPEAIFMSPLYIHITLATDTETESPSFAQQLQRQKHVENHLTGF